MARAFARRLLAAVLVAWAVATLCFALIQAVPGKPIPELDRPGISREAAAHVRALLGTERPVWERYSTWLLGLVRGDLGFSLHLRRPVVDVVREALGKTLALTGTALLVEIALGVALGVVAARLQTRWVDRAATASATVLYSLPSFWVGLFLVLVFALELQWLPVSQMRSVDAAALPTAARFGDFLRHLILPCAALALPSAAGLALYVRDELRSASLRPHLVAASARGAHPRRVVLAHALPMALLPVVQLVGLSLQALVGGSVVIEFLFAWPGVGRLAYEGVLARDEPLILGCTILGALAVVVGNSLADVMAAAVDPRFVKEVA